MSYRNLQDYFQRVTTKYLKQVDANPKKSNQHEIGGLEFKDILGVGIETHYYDCNFVYISDETDNPIIDHN